MLRLTSIAAIAAALIVAGCGDDDSSESAPEGTAAATTEAPPPATTAEQAATGTEIVLAGSEFGEILFDGDDQAIYLFDKEDGPASECYGDCAAAWPPVLTKGDPQAGAGLKAGLLGTTERDDGTTQVTYNGHPLYYYAHEGPGEVTCHDVAEFGGLWLVVDAQGEAV